MPLEPSESTAKLAVRGIVRVGLLVCLCLVAVRFGWTQMRIFLILLLAMLAVNLFVIWRYNPVLLRERLKKDKPTEPFDRFVIAALGPLGLSVFVVAGLDVLHYGWSQLPLGASWIGAALFALGNIPVVWSMAVNPHLERVVRLQEERGHRVITSGPYRFVRHPMYAGLLLMMAGWPLVLGSLWSYLPTVLMGAVMVARTGFEDRMLIRELPGYEEFSRHTRHRLVPGVW